MKPASMGARISAAIMDLFFVSFLSYLVTIPILHFVDLDTVLREAGERAQEGEIQAAFLLGILGLVLLMGFLTHGYYMYFESTSGPNARQKNLRPSRRKYGRWSYHAAASALARVDTLVHRRLVSAGRSDLDGDFS